MIAGVLPDGWLEVVQLLGAVQGIFLAAILSGSRSNRVANRFLAVMMAAFSLDLFMAWVYATGFEGRWPHLIAADFVLPFLYGPLLYLYARTIEEGGRHAPPTAWRHFVPLAAVALLMIPFYGLPADAKLLMRTDPSAQSWTPVLDWLNRAKLAYSLVYIVATFRVVRRHRASIRLRFASEDRMALIWLRNILIGGFGMWLLSTGVYVVGWALGAGDPLAGFSDAVSLALAVFIYAIGYLGLRQHAVPEWVVSPAGPSHSATNDIVDVATPSMPRYERSGLTSDRISELAAALDRTMDETRAYRSTDLSLADLARRLDVPPHHLSETLNAGHGRNFYDYVNGWRVQDVKRRLEDPADDHFTVLALALDAGFASKSAFNATFRKHVGMTPSEYRSRVRG